MSEENLTLAEINIALIDKFFEKNHICPKCGREHSGYCYYCGARIR